MLRYEMWRCNRVISQPVPVPSKYIFDNFAFVIIADYRIDRVLGCLYSDLIVCEFSQIHYFATQACTLQFAHETKVIPILFGAQYFVSRR